MAAEMGPTQGRIVGIADLVEIGHSRGTIQKSGMLQEISRLQRALVFYKQCVLENRSAVCQANGARGNHVIIKAQVRERDHKVNDEP